MFGQIKIFGSLTLLFVWRVFVSLTEEEYSLSCTVWTNKNIGYFNFTICMKSICKSYRRRVFIIMQCLDKYKYFGTLPPVICDLCRTCTPLFLAWRRSPMSGGQIIHSKIADGISVPVVMTQLTTIICLENVPFIFRMPVFECKHCNSTLRC